MAFPRGSSQNLSLSAPQPLAEPPPPPAAQLPAAQPPAAQLPVAQPLLVPQKWDSGLLEMDKALEVKKNVLLVGNPGVGKSTLLNALAGQVVFRSGVSLGKGLTYKLQEILSEDGIRYIDTPGLADAKLRKAAADAIQEALQKDGDYQIIFVICLQAGRISAQDAATIQTVLEACPSIGNQYAIVINKLSAPVAKKLSQPHNLGEVCACLFGCGVPATMNVFLNLKSDELEDLDDVLHKPSSDLLHFLDVVSVIHISPQEVSGLQHANYDKREVDLSEIFRVMQGNQQAMMDQMSKQQDLIQKQIEEMTASRKQKSSWKNTILHVAESAAVPFLEHEVGAELVAHGW